MTNADKYQGSWEEWRNTILFRLDAQDEQLKNVALQLQTLIAAVQQGQSAIEAKFSEKVNNVDRVFADKVNSLNENFSRNVSDVKSSVAVLNLKLAGIAAGVATGTTGLIRFIMGH